MASRRRARRSALQILYELDSTSHDPDEVLSRLLYEESIDDDTYAFISELVKGVIAHVHNIDSVLAKHAPAFPVNQMATIDRNILRIALYELMYTDDTPVKVCISEAVELAKYFAADPTRKLVNGVLGAVASKEIDSTDETTESSDS
jgi:N utilization substance protein B